MIRERVIDNMIIEELGERRPGCLVGASWINVQATLIPALGLNGVWGASSARRMEDPSSGAHSSAVNHLSLHEKQNSDYKPISLEIIFHKTILC